MGATDDPPGSGIRNDYLGNTTLNTTFPWWSAQDQKLDGKLDAHIDGMTAYAKNEATISQNIGLESGNLGSLSSLPAQGLGTHGFPEGVQAADYLVRNASEMATYVQNLAAAVLNTGMAAQTVADSYLATDGSSAANLSAISMNAVNFAFARPGATRPANLPKGIGKTYDQELQSEGINPNAPSHIDPSKVDKKQQTADGWIMENPDGSTTTHTTTQSAPWSEGAGNTTTTTDTTVYTSGPQQGLTVTTVTTTGMLMPLTGSTANASTVKNTVTTTSFPAQTDKNGNVVVPAYSTTTTGRTVTTSEPGDITDSTTTTTTVTPQVTNQGATVVPASSQSSTDEKVTENFDNGFTQTTSYADGQQTGTTWTDQQPDGSTVTTQFDPSGQETAVSENPPPPAPPKAPPDDPYAKRSAEIPHQWDNQTIVDVVEDIFD